MVILHFWKLKKKKNSFLPLLIFVGGRNQNQNQPSSSASIAAFSAATSKLFARRPPASSGRFTPADWSRCWHPWGFRLDWRHPHKLLRIELRRLAFVQSLVHSDHGLLGSCKEYRLASSLLHCSFYHLLGVICQLHCWQLVIRIVLNLRLWHMALSFRVLRAYGVGQNDSCRETKTNYFS